MIKKISLILKCIFLLVLLSNCGFEPIYKNINNKINIEIISIQGETNINNHFKNKFKSYMGSGKTDIYKIKIISKYDEIILVKDSLGNVTNYRIKLNVVIYTNKKGKDLSFNYDKTFDFNKTSSAFEDENYERIVLKDMINSIIEEFVVDIMQIE